MVLLSNFRIVVSKRSLKLQLTSTKKTENIGARRLHTLVERVLEDLLFQTGQTASETVTIDRSYVESRLSELSQDEDLSQYIL